MKYSILLVFIYILFILLSFAFAIQNKRGSYSVSKRQRFLLLCFFFLFVVHAFKEYSGFSDLPLYIDGLSEVNKLSWRSIIEDSITSFKCERGFALFLKLISLISLSPLFLFFVTSFIILLGYYRIMRFYSVLPWLSVILLLTGPYVQSLYVLRQYTAISICLFSVPFIINRKIVPYLLLVLLAFSFHQTMIIFLPLYFLYGIKSSKLLGIVMLAITIVCVIAFQVISMYIGNALSGYESFLEGEETSRWHMTAVLVALLIIRIIVLRKRFFDQGIERLLSIALILAIAIAVGGSSLAMIGRVNIVFTAFGCLYVPSTLLSIQSKPIRFAAIISFLLVFSYVFYSSLSWDSIEDAYTFWRL